MALNLEGFRKEIARELYKDVAQHTPGAPDWFDLHPSARKSFEKMGGVCLGVIFRKNPKDVIEFFTGVEK